MFNLLKLCFMIRSRKEKKLCRIFLLSSPKGASLHASYTMTETCIKEIKTNGLFYISSSPFIAKWFKCPLKCSMHKNCNFFSTVHQLQFNYLPWNVVRISMLSESLDIFSTIAWNSKLWSYNCMLQLKHIN